MQRYTSAVTLRGMFLLLCTSSLIAHARGSTNMADEVLHTEDNHCKPILVNGELMPTEPEYMPSFPVSLKGIKRNFVCKLAAPKTVSTTPPTTSRPTHFASTTSREATTNSIMDSTISNPTTTTKSTTTQDTTTMPTTEATTSHSMTTTRSTTSLETTTNSIPDSTASNPTTTTKSTTMQDTTTMPTTEATTSHSMTTTPSTTTLEATTDSTTSNPTTTAKSTTTQVTTIMSTTGSSTSRTTTATQSTAKIFVTDEGTENKIFVADLQDDLDFTSIPSTKEPRYITYDSVEKKIYWTDKDTRRVYRADVDGANREEVNLGSGDDLGGIAIAETSRTLYIANKYLMKITSVSIAQGSPFPRDEMPFTSKLSKELYSLEVDEEKGFLYWSMKYNIQRKSLNGSGSTETIFYNNLSEITGLSIDLSRNPRRIFFCDFGKERSFYMDVNQPPTTAHELTGYMNDTDFSGDEEREKLRDISYFNGTLYWTKEDDPNGIAVMTDYDQSSRSFDIKENLGIQKPYQLLIINVDP